MDKRIKQIFKGIIGIAGAGITTITTSIWFLIAIIIIENLGVEIFTLAQGFKLVKYYVAPITLIMYSIININELNKTHNPNCANKNPKGEKHN